MKSFSSASSAAAISSASELLPSSLESLLEPPSSSLSLSSSSLSSLASSSFLLWPLKIETQRRRSVMLVSQRSLERRAHWFKAVWLPGLRMAVLSVVDSDWLQHSVMVCRPLVRMSQSPPVSDRHQRRGSVPGAWSAAKQQKLGWHSLRIGNKLVSKVWLLKSNKLTNLMFCGVRTKWSINYYIS